MSKLLWSIGLSLVCSLMSVVWAAVPGGTYTVTTNVGEERLLAYLAGRESRTQEQVIQQLCGTAIARAQRLRADQKAGEIGPSYLEATPEVQEQVDVLLGLTPSP